MFDTDQYETLFGQLASMRTHREEFLATVEAGSVTLSEIFERGADDPVIGSLKVLTAIEALPDSGKVQTRRAFEDVGIAEDAHVEHVTPAQVAELPSAMDRHAR